MAKLAEEVSFCCLKTQNSQTDRNKNKYYKEVLKRWGEEGKPLHTYHL